MRKLCILSYHGCHISYLQELEEQIDLEGDFEVIKWGASHKGMGAFLWGKMTPYDTM